MGLITLNGDNPFEGQTDPFVGFSISYESMGGQNSDCHNESNDQKRAVYSLSLNGHITGCSFGELNSARGEIKDAFLPDEGITSFVVEGIDLPNENASFVLRDINFSSSDYLGVIPYSIQVDIKKLLKEESKIISKTHSLSFNIPAQSENTVNYRIGAVGLETGDCLGLQRAIDWVTENTLIDDPAKDGDGLLGYNGLGTVVNPDHSLILTSQGESIDRASNSYERTFSYRATKEDATDITHDYSITTSDQYEGGQETPTESTSYRGTFSFLGNPTKLPADSRAKLFDAYDKYVNGVLPSDDGESSSLPLSVNYNSGNNSLSYNFTYPEGGDCAGEGQEVWDYTLNTSQPEGGEKVWSINGNVSINGGSSQKKKEALEAIDKNSIIERMKTWCGSDVIERSSSIDTDDINGTISFGGSFVKASTLNGVDAIALDGVDGLSSYSVSLTPARAQFGVVYVLGGECDKGGIILDAQRNTRASISISAGGMKGPAPDGMGETDEAVEAALSTYVEDKKNEFISAATNIKSNPPVFDIDENGCASYSQSFSWKTTNTANSSESPAQIIGDLRG